MMIWLMLGQWNAMLVDPAGDVGYDAALALDSQDWPHIAYCDHSAPYSVKYARWTGSGWQIQGIDNTGSTTFGGYTCIALDSQDRPHISYVYHIDPMNVDLKYAKWTGSSWQIQTVDTDGSAIWVSMALNSLDRPSMTYSDIANSIVEYAFWNGASWQRQQVTTLAIYSSLAIDSQDRPHISYYYYPAASRSLRYAYWNGSSWQISTVDTGNVGLWSSIALDSLDRPCISYYDSAATRRNLKYAYWNGSSWQIQTVDTVGDVGRYTSLALDSQDRPHIAYYDVTNTRLKYAYWTGTGWQIEVADPNSYAGYWKTDRSLMIGSDDCPRVAYYRQSDLYYGHRGCPPVDVAEEDSREPRFICVPSTGALVFIAPTESPIRIYASDGRLVHFGQLLKGQNRISLDQGVYLWRAGTGTCPYKGKAVVR